MHQEKNDSRPRRPRFPTDADVVDLHDVGAIEESSRASLIGETFHGDRVGREMRVQHLERDDPAETNLLGLVDDSHPPAPDLSEKTVVPDDLFRHVLSPAYGSGPPRSAQGTIIAASPRL